MYAWGNPISSLRNPIFGRHDVIAFRGKVPSCGQSKHAISSSGRALTTILIFLSKLSSQRVFCAITNPHWLLPDNGLDVNTIFTPSFINRPVLFNNVHK